MFQPSCRYKMLGLWILDFVLCHAYIDISIFLLSVSAFTAQCIMPYSTITLCRFWWELSGHSPSFIKQYLQGMRLQRLTVSPSVPQWDLSAVLGELSHEPYCTQWGFPEGAFSALYLVLSSAKRASNLYALLVHLCCVLILRGLKRCCVSDKPFMYIQTLHIWAQDGAALSISSLTNGTWSEWQMDLRSYGAFLHLSTTPNASKHSPHSHTHLYTNGLHCLPYTGFSIQSGPKYSCVRPYTHTHSHMDRSVIGSDLGCSI